MLTRAPAPVARVMRNGEIFICVSVLVRFERIEKHKKHDPPPHAQASTHARTYARTRRAVRYCTVYRHASAVCGCVCIVYCVLCLCLTTRTCGLLLFIYFMFFFSCPCYHIVYEESVYVMNHATTNENVVDDIIAPDQVRRPVFFKRCGTREKARGRNGDGTTVVSYR